MAIGLQTYHDTPTREDLLSVLRDATTALNKELKKSKTKKGMEVLKRWLKIKR